MIKMSKTIMRALGIAAVLLPLTATACDLNKALSVQPANLIDAVALDQSPANASLLVNGAASDFDCAFGSYVVVGALIGQEFEDGLQTADRWPYDQRTVDGQPVTLFAELLHRARHLHAVAGRARLGEQHSPFARGLDGRAGARPLDAYRARFGIRGVESARDRRSLLRDGVFAGAR